MYMIKTNGKKWVPIFYSLKSIFDGKIDGLKSVFKNLEHLNWK